MYQLKQGYIDLFAYARIDPVHSIDRSNYTKANRASLEVSREHKIYGKSLDIRSSIPRGKGMASSTSEIAASILAA